MASTITHQWKQLDLLYKFYVPGYSIYIGLLLRRTLERLEQPPTFLRLAVDRITKSTSVRRNNRCHYCKSREHN